MFITFTIETCHIFSLRPLYRNHKLIRRYGWTSPNKMINALEIDFLPVGSNSKSGDAICFRFGNYENGNWKSQYVFVLDGGNLESGQALVDHITNVYRTDKVDRVILTHPDGDHASGLRTVLEQLKVDKVWMHRPWNHWHDLKGKIVDGRITKASWGDRLKAAYGYAYEVEQLALQKKIPIFPPHQGIYYHLGDNIPILRVLGPNKELYTSLIEMSDKTPATNLFEASKFFAKASNTVYEDLTFETENLAEQDEETSCENDMSLILYLEVAGAKVLFTADAGTMGLYKAIYYAIEHGINLKDLNLLQIPHHGSRHNLSKGILTHLYAPYGVISSAVQGEPHHPSPVVTNALIRRNIMPCSTKGILLNFHSGDVPMRSGLSSVSPLNFIYTFDLSD